MTPPSHSLGCLDSSRARATRGCEPWRDQTLYRLLLLASRETASTLQAVQAAGFQVVSIVDTNLLANLDTDGTIIAAVARRAAVIYQTDRGKACSTAPSTSSRTAGTLGRG